MPTLIFATNNQHKVDEIQSLVGTDFNIIPLKEAGIDIDIPEPHDSLQENAAEKANTIFALTQQNCFSEDKGLEIEALAGEARALRRFRIKIANDHNPLKSNKKK